MLAIAAYMAFMASVLSTSNLISSITIKFIPLVSAFTLGLIAFKVI